MAIQKKGKKCVLKSKTTGKTLGTHSSKADAKRQERAIQVSKRKKKRKG